MQYTMQHVRYSCNTACYVFVYTPEAYIVCTIHSYFYERVFIWAIVVLVPIHVCVCVGVRVYVRVCIRVLVSVRRCQCVGSWLVQARSKLVNNASEAKSFYCQQNIPPNTSPSTSPSSYPLPHFHSSSGIRVHQ